MEYSFNGIQQGLRPAGASACALTKIVNLSLILRVNGSKSRRFRPENPVTFHRVFDKIALVAMLVCVLELPPHAASESKAILIGLHQQMLAKTAGGNLQPGFSGRFV
jgi:hypothetical protein